MSLPRVADFAINGAGTAPAWGAAPEIVLSRVGKGQASYATRALWSSWGIYFLFDCKDVIHHNPRPEGGAGQVTGRTW